MRNWGFKEKLCYKFDKLMSRGTMAIVCLLGIITFLLVLLTALISYFAGGVNNSFLESIWIQFNRTLDPGTLGGDTGSFTFMLMLTVSTLVGVFITSGLIGIITNGLDTKYANLRKGKSKVLESDHVIILGFNDDVYVILEQLIIANENKPRACVVVLGNEEKEVMEERISAVIPDTKTTTIVCRSGESFNRTDIAKCSFETCRSIIVNEKDDFLVIKTILAVTNMLYENRNAYLVATIRNKQNFEAAKLAGEGRAIVLYFKNIVARIIAHVCNQPGMSSVFLELIDFDGDEIYFKDFPQLYGKTFGETLLMFDKCTIIGMEKGGACRLKPPMNTPYEKGCKLIAIAQDDSITVPITASSPTQALPAKNSSAHLEKLKILFLGTNELLPDILSELDNYLAKDSYLLIAYPDSKDEVSLMPFNNFRCEMKQCDIYNPQVLLDFMQEGFDHVVILSNTETSEEDSDAKTLLLLLHLREIAQANGYRFSITSEMLKTQNQELAKVAKVNDFVISSNIASLMMAQLSQNKHLNVIFQDLLDEDGSEIYFMPASRFVDISKPLSMYTITATLAAQEIIFIGYKRTTGKEGEFEIILNPKKSETIAFGENDLFIVISETNK